MRKHAILFLLLVLSTSTSRLEETDDWLRGLPLLGSTQVPGPYRPSVSTVASLSALRTALMHARQSSPAQRQTIRAAALDQLKWVRPSDLRTQIEKEWSLAEFFMNEGDLGDRLPSGLSEEFRNQAVGNHVRLKVGRLVQRWQRYGIPAGVRLGQLETTYRNWFRGTASGPALRRQYERMRVARLEQALKDHRTQSALDELRYWEESPLWERETPKSAQRDLATRLLASYFYEHTDAAEAPFRKNEGLLQPFLPPPYHAIWVELGLRVHDVAAVERIMRRHPQSCEFALTDPKLDGYLKLSFSDGWMDLLQWKRAERCLSLIEDPRFRSRVLNRMGIVAAETHRYEEAFQSKWELVGRGEESQTERQLLELLNVAEKGRLWQKAQALRRLAETKGLRGNNLAPFLYFTGRAGFLRADCPSAVPPILDALRIAPQHSQSNEARYQLARCFQKQNKKLLAQNLLMELAGRKDMFWSRLAQAEMNSRR